MVKSLKAILDGALKPVPKLAFTVFTSVTSVTTAHFSRNFVHVNDSSRSQQNRGERVDVDKVRLCKGAPNQLKLGTMQLSAFNMQMPFFEFHSSLI